MIWSSGLDLGQAQDFSALAVLEVSGTDQKCEVPGGFEILEGPPIIRMACRHLERFPLQTRYSDVVASVRSRLKRLKGESYLSVDKTGVGAGPLEQLEAPDKDGKVLNPIGITITSGNQAQLGAHIRDAHVPKKDLVAVVQIALQNRVLLFDKKLPFVDTLEREVQNFRVKISATGHDSYNAWRERDHDDLLLALACACWTAEQMMGRMFRLGMDAIHDKRNARRSGFGGEGSISSI